MCFLQSARQKSLCDLQLKRVCCIGFFFFFFFFFFSHVFLSWLVVARALSEFHAAFLPAFAVALSKDSSSNGRLIDFYIMLFSSAVEGDDAVLLPVIAACQKVCNSVLARKAVGREKATSTYKRFSQLALCLNVKLAAAWIAALEAVGADDLHRAAGAFYVGLRCKNGQLSASQHEAFVKSWKNSFLVGARTELPAALHDAFGPLPKAADVPSIAADMSRMLKRSPEYSAQNVAGVLGAIPSSLVAACQGALLADVVSLLISSRDNVRAAGIRICHFLALAANGSSADAAKELFRTVASSLTSGAAGKATEGRLAVVAAAVAVLEAWSGSTDLLGAMPLLVAAANGESSFEVKGELLQALGTCIVRGAPLSTDALGLFGGVIRDESKPTLIRLQAISGLGRSIEAQAAEEGRKVAEPIVRDLVKLAGALSTNVNGQQLVLPLLYPCVCAGATELIQSVQALWLPNGFLVNSASALNVNSSAFFGRSTELGRELSTLALSGLLGSDASLSHADGSWASALLQSFCCLVSSNCKQIRRTAIACARKAAKTSSLASSMLRFGLTIEAGSDLVLLPFLKQLDPVPSSNILLQTVQIFASPKLDASLLPKLVLALHHPRVVQQPGASVSIFKLALRQCEKQGHAATPGFLELAVALIFSSRGVFSSCLENVSAASDALRSICAVGGEAAVDAMVKALVKAWEEGRSQVKLSSRDVAIFNTPDGQLFEEPQLDEYVPEQVEARRKNNEEEWAEAIRAEIAAKKGQQHVDEKAKAGMSKRDAAMRDARERQALVEGVIRVRVRDIMTHASGVLKAVLAIATTPSAVGCKTHLVALFPVVAALVGSPLVGKQAEHVASVLAKFSPDALRGGYRCSLPLALARLRAPANPSEQANAVWSAAEILATVLKGGAALEPGPFSVVFPLVQAAIDSPNSSSLLDAVSILELHSSKSGSAYPRGEMASALLNAMVLNEALGSRCSKACVDLGERFLTSDVAVLYARYPTLQFGIAREALLRCVAASPVMKPGPERSPPASSIMVGWISRHDPETHLATLASQIWSASGQASPSADQPSSLLGLFLPFLSSELSWVRSSASAALVDLATRENLDGLLSAVFARFVVDDEDTSVPLSHEGHLGLAVVLSSLSVRMDPAQVLRTVNWIISSALVETVESDELRGAFTSAGAGVIAQAGGQCMDPLWALLNETNQRLQHEELESKTDKEADEKKALQLCCIIFIASLASHMQPDDKRLLSIVSSLIDSLLVASESMQPSIAQHLAPLMAVIPEEEVQAYVTRLFKTVESSKERYERHGAAWAMAGLVKGRKLPALKKYDILKGIEKLLKDKKRAYAREGALNMIECLVQTLGQGFEAYYIFLLQQLLDRYGDGSVEVRAAAEATAKCIMANLSASGVRLVLGPLLKSLSGSDWRRKKGGIELLGSMAFISPAQLSSCLPSIVPVLTQVLADTHQKVQEAAKEALQNIGGVISNPEIKQHVPLVLRCLNDPDSYTEPLLRALLHTQFVHVIDAPSLALLMPAVTRALSFRNLEAKLMAVQIVGNIGSLTKPADLAHYLTTLSEEMRNLLIDPAPEIRATCARAWGNLLRGMGESKFPDLAAWLINNFETSPLQSTRAGSAQGLGELLASVPQERFDQLFAEVLDRTDHVNSGVRQGALLTIAYLPGPDTSAKRIEPLLERIFEIVLRGVSDESDEVRTASLDAGRALLTRFVHSKLDLFVPQLEAGVFSPAWRTRFSSLQLLGELLTLCGNQGTAAAAAAAAAGAPLSSSSSDSEGGASKFHEERLAQVLGQDRLDRVLASLYVIRCESNATVKQKSLLVWKSKRKICKYLFFYLPNFYFIYFCFFF